MKDVKKQHREKHESNVKTKLSHSIASPSTTSSSLSSAAAANVVKITKKSYGIQKRTAAKSNSVQTKLISVKNENGIKSIVVSKVGSNSASAAADAVVAAASTTREVNKDRNDKRLIKGDSKRVATQVESKVSVETPKKLTQCKQSTEPVEITSMNLNCL